jgi:hypothetical protein
MYHAGYGPTNETLGRYIRDLFGQNIAFAAAQAAKGGTHFVGPVPGSKSG